MRAKQRGATLLVGLIMLVLLTLLAVSAINISTVNLHITGNMQAQVEAAAAAQQAIEELIDDINNFNNPPDTYKKTVGKYYAVEVQKPVCLQAIPLKKGYSYSVSYVPEETTWDIQASATDSQTTGVSTTIHQGVRVLLPPGKCP
jgi:Tfp pilus assembly protein PilX